MRTNVVSYVLVNNIMLNNHNNIGKFLSNLNTFKTVQNYDRERVEGTLAEFELIPKLEMVTLIIEIKNIMNKIKSFNTIAGLWSGFLLIFSPPMIRNNAPTPI